MSSLTLPRLLFRIRKIMTIHELLLLPGELSLERVSKLQPMTEIHISKIKDKLPWWLSGKESACQAGDVDLIPGSERSLGEGNGNPLQYSCLENSMDRGAWQATVHRVAIKSDTT